MGSEAIKLIKAVGVMSAPIAAGLLVVCFAGLGSKINDRVVIAMIPTAYVCGAVYVLAQGPSLMRRLRLGLILSLVAIAAALMKMAIDGRMAEGAALLVLAAVLSAPLVIASARGSSSVRREISDKIFLAGCAAVSIPWFLLTGWIPLDILLHQPKSSWALVVAASLALNGCPGLLSLLRGVVWIAREGFVEALSAAGTPVSEVYEEESLFDGLINPATGCVMVGDVDTSGHPYGSG
ncbi:MAG: hypothetical protein OJJ21_19235 [Ferrovibrio sp.]|uniref:hypothetical protein n=1 Tax=Ferrovibrio sp. TaxID=1917215 RepID=UPI002614A218|nr:hypothetical protein [Ferrovibrio sp.]MCW0235743.1 hypothetical protein [Ferrovibrio sp.]